MLMTRERQSAEAKAAVAAAQRSHEQAQRDLSKQQAGLKAAERSVARLRQHTAANHYDLWIIDMVLRRKGA